MVADEPVLRKRPILQNENRIVAGPVLEKRPGGNPTMIETAGLAIKDGGITDNESRALQKRPIIHNGGAIVKGPRPVLEKRPAGNPTMIQNAGPAIKDGGVTDNESRALQKRPIIHNGGAIVKGPRPVLEKRPAGNPTMIKEDTGTLQKRPVVQNDTRIVEGPVLEKRPVGNPTLIEDTGTLQKRPVVQNDNRIVEGPSRRNGVSETRRGALQKRPVIKNGGFAIETGAVGNSTNREGSISVLEKRPEISNSTGRRA
ncbi:hypothetical protein B0H14DRAFT_2587072 [Mycena olivaceomarginata]|nr:hypothetical protein B0H14DRAFT_2587072 [Mycena olivaceomarginata]